MPPEEAIQPAVLIPSFGFDVLFFEAMQRASDLLPAGYALLKTSISYAIVISIPLSVFFLIGIIYSVEQLKKIKIKERLKYDVKIEPAFEEAKGQGSRDLTVRWHKVTSLLNSQNPNDWKQAILEADTMLLDVLTGLGYQGDGVGEKLKRVQTGEFKHINEAWEAHKVRNQIAHEPGFTITHHEAVRTIHLYRKVFEEFYYV